MRKVYKLGFLAAIITVVTIALAAIQSTPDVGQAVVAQVEQQTADTIYTNGKVYTVEQDNPWAEAFAVKNGRFVAVGKTADIKKLKTAGTKVVDLGGHFVMPSFIDAHIHPIRSQLLTDVDMYISAATPPTPEEFAAKIKTYAEENPDKPWLIGAAFSWGTFAEVELNSAFIDAIISDRPVIIEDETGHIAIANSKALELSGITKDIEDPVGGYFGREEDGSLNGLLYETALQEVFKDSPNYTEEQVYNAGETIFSQLNALGITGLKICQGDQLWATAIKRLDEDGKLSQQISLAPYPAFLTKIF